MKFIYSSLLLALASTAVAADPVSTPVQPIAAASAPSAERLDLARRYMALGNTDHLMEAMRAVMMRSASGQAEGAEEQAAAERYIKRLFVVAAPKIRERVPAILEASAQAYAREFSAEELQHMITFAQTPTGKHFIARGANVETDPAVIDAQMKVWEDLRPAMEQVGKELCAEKAAQRLAAGDKTAKCPLAEKDETAAG